MLVGAIAGFATTVFTGNPWVGVLAAAAAGATSSLIFGFLTLSLYPLLRGLVTADQPVFPGVRQVINYGLEKLRFPSAVLSGSRVRARCVLLKVEAVTGGL